MEYAWAAAFTMGILIVASVIIIVIPRKTSTAKIKMKPLEIFNVVMVAAATFISIVKIIPSAGTPAAAATNGCGDTRLVDHDQWIGPTLVIDGSAVTTCQNFLGKLAKEYRPIFGQVRAHDEQVLRSGRPYKIAYFVAPLSSTDVAVSLPPSPL